MKVSARSTLKLLLAMLAASAELFTQSSGPGQSRDHASVVDTRQIVGQSVAATERSWQARDHYTYTERDDDRRSDALGQVKSEDINVTRMSLVNGARFEQLTEHNGQLPTTNERRKSDEHLDKLMHETTDTTNGQRGSATTRKTGPSYATCQRPSTSSSSTRK